jgi:serine/threonine protein phosphatase PrpC
VAFATNIGTGHAINQDAGGAWVWCRADGTTASLTVVADGVSAGRHSEEASRLTVGVIHDLLAPRMEDLSPTIEALIEELRAAATEANHQVAARPHPSIGQADATTLVAAVCVGNEGGGVWCGDSRVYRFSSKGVTRLTQDHSWAETVVSSGLMTAEQATQDPRAHMITRWLGPPDSDDPGIDTFRVRLEPGDTLLCCTDGLYMYFSPPYGAEREMASILASYRADLPAALQRLVDVALSRGGYDNITVAATRLSGLPSSAPDGGSSGEETIELGRLPTSDDRMPEEA